MPVNFPVNPLVQLGDTNARWHLAEQQTPFAPLHKTATRP